VDSETHKIELKGISPPKDVVLSFSQLQ